MSAGGGLDAAQNVRFNDAVISGETLKIYAGKGGLLESLNQLDGYADAQVFMASAWPNIAAPDADMDIDESNHIEILGESIIRSLGNLYLESREGIGGGDRGAIYQASMSLSMVPYGEEKDERGFADSENTLVIAPEALVEAAVNNKVVLYMGSLVVDGRTADIYGEALSTEEKEEFFLDPDLDYRFERLLVDESTFYTDGETEEETQAATDSIAEITDRFYVVLPEVMSDTLPVMTLENVQSMLLDQYDALQEWIVNHASDPEAVARYQAQLEQVELALESMGLVETFTERVNNGGQVFPFAYAVSKQPHYSRIDGKRKDLTPLATSTTSPSNGASSGRAAKNEQTPPGIGHESQSWGAVPERRRDRNRKRIKTDIPNARQGLERRAVSVRNIAIRLRHPLAAH